MLSNDITVSSAIVLESLWETAYTMFVAELFEQSENARITQHWLIQCWVILRWKNQRNKIKIYVKIYKLLIESIRFRNSKRNFLQRAVDKRLFWFYHMEHGRKSCRQQNIPKRTIKRNEGALRPRMAAALLLVLFRGKMGGGTTIPNN